MALFVTLVRSLHLVCVPKDSLSNGRHFTGVINLFPPTRLCEEENCARGYKTSAGYLQPQELGEERVYQVTVFTQAYGPLPGYAASLACPSKFIYLVSPCSDS